MTLVEQTKHPKRNPVAANGHNGHNGQALIVSVKRPFPRKMCKIGPIFPRKMCNFGPIFPRKMCKTIIFPFILGGNRTHLYYFDYFCTDK